MLNAEFVDLLVKAVRERGAFDLPEGEMEVGIGIHGEPGRRREKLASADAIVDELVEEFDSGKPNFLKRREASRSEQIEQVGARLRPLMSWLGDDEDQAGG